MKLRALIQDLKIKNKSEIPNISIQAIAYDSRQVVPGAIFVAIRGLSRDGHQYIPLAIEKGAVAVVGEEGSQEIGDRRQELGGRELKVPFISVPNSREALAQLSSRFYGEPTRDLPVVGVTGTNGKTTITYLVEAFLQGAGRSPAVVGTINYRHGEKIYPASHTTPESYDLQKWIRQVKEEGADTLVMEVSSHALDLHRVDKIHFDVCVFTNLTPEHLDYHQNMETYFKAKKRLFEELLLRSAKDKKWAVFNRDDLFGERLFTQQTPASVLSFSLDREKKADLFPASTDFSIEGIKARVVTPWGEMKIQSSLLGAFNLSNLLAAIAVAGSQGVPLHKMEEVISHFSVVPGRLERVSNAKGIHVFVDYAHTPDALKNVLHSLRGLIEAHGHAPLPPRILVVFGCGGDRDKSKRPLMGAEVAKAADWAVVTSDNPRGDDPVAIIQDILPGLLGGGWKKDDPFQVEPDRSQAIHLALQTAGPGDIVLIAGKGHEDYQILGKNKIHFDDREVAREFFEKISPPL